MNSTHQPATPGIYRIFLHPQHIEQHQKLQALLGVSAGPIQELREMALNLATRALWQAQYVVPNRTAADAIYNGFENQERWHDAQMRRLYDLRREMDAATARNKYAVERCENRVEFIQHDLQLSGWQVEDERRIHPGSANYERDLIEQKYRDYTGVLEMKGLIEEYRGDQRRKQGVHDAHREKICGGILNKWSEYIQSLPLGRPTLMRYRQNKA